MFDLDKPLTLPEQVKELVLVLSIQPIVCGIVNIVGFRLAAHYAQPPLASVILLATFLTTGAFLAMNAAAVGACALLLRTGETPELRPLAHWSLALSFVTSLVLVALFFFGGWKGNAAAAGCGLALMLLAMIFPAKMLAPKK